MVIQIPTLTNFYLFGLQMVVWYSKGDLITNLSLAQYSNGIQIPDHLVIERVQLHAISLNLQVVVTGVLRGLVYNFQGSTMLVQMPFV